MVRGGKSGRYLIRGIGPALTQFGVGGALAAPVLTLTTAQGAPLATNAGWSLAANAAEIPAVASQMGAFPLTAGSKDAVLLLTLEPGTYTAQVRGTEATSGVALLEIYEIP